MIDRYAAEWKKEVTSEAVNWLELTDRELQLCVDGLALLSVMPGREKDEEITELGTRLCAFLPEEAPVQRDAQGLRRRVPGKPRRKRRAKQKS